MKTTDTIIDGDLAVLFAAHCECRPLDLYRTEDDHAHDCDTAILSDVQVALFATDEGAATSARCRCVACWNEDLQSDIYRPRLEAARFPRIGIGEGA